MTQFTCNSFKNFKILTKYIWSINVEEYMREIYELRYVRGRYEKEYIKKDMREYIRNINECTNIEYNMCTHMNFIQFMHNIWRVRNSIISPDVMQIF